MTAWKLEHLRLTLFLQDSIPNGSELWTSIVGAEPEHESLTRERGVRSYAAEAPRSNGILQLRTQPDGDRIDWFLGVVPSLTGVGSPSPVAGEIDDYVPEFRSLIQSQAARGLVASRLAVGAILLQPVISKEDGYEKLNALLQGAKVLPGSSDFFYRVNRPVPSTVQKDVVLNRLGEWSVAQLVSVNLAPAGSSVGEPASEFMVRAGIDINTSPDNRVAINQDVGHDLINEMLALALKAIESGDA